MLLVVRERQQLPNNNASNLLPSRATYDCDCLSPKLSGAHIDMPCLSGSIHAFMLFHRGRDIQLMFAREMT
jgi:hypothetical protein